MECASLDGKACLRGRGTTSCQAWVKELTSGKAQAKPLTCGPAHKAVHGITGYDTPGHWCSALLAFYQAPSTYCTKYNKSLNVQLAGCGISADCDPNGIIPGVFEIVKTADGKEIQLPVKGSEITPEKGGQEGTYSLSAYLMNRCKTKSPLFLMTTSFWDPGELRPCPLLLSRCLQLATDGCRTQPCMYIQHRLTSQCAGQGLNGDPQSPPPES